MFSMNKNKSFAPFMFFVFLPLCIAKAGKAKENTTHLHQEKSLFSGGLFSFPRTTQKMDMSEFKNAPSRMFWFKVSNVLGGMCKEAPNIVKEKLGSVSLQGKFVCDTLEAISSSEVESLTVEALREVIGVVTRSEPEKWANTPPRRLALFLTAVRRAVGEEAFEGLLADENREAFPSSPDVTSPQAAHDTEEEAVAAEVSRKRFTFAPRADGGLLPGSAGGGGPAAGDTLDAQSFGGGSDIGDDADDAGVDADDVTLNHKRWQELDRIQQGDLLANLRGYIPTRDGDAKDAAHASWTLIQKILKGRSMVDILGDSLDNLLFFHYRFTLGVEAAKAFRMRGIVGSTTTPTRRQAMLAAVAANNTHKGKRSYQGGGGRQQQNKRMRYDPSASFNTKGAGKGKKGGEKGS